VSWFKAVIERRLRHHDIKEEGEEEGEKEEENSKLGQLVQKSELELLGTLEQASLHARSLSCRPLNIVKALRGIYLQM